MHWLVESAFRKTRYSPGSQIDIFDTESSSYLSIGNIDKGSIISAGTLNGGGIGATAASTLGGSAGGNLFLNPYGGKIGVGTVTPTVALDVSGAIRPGSSAAVTACGLGAANGEGSQRYNYTKHVMEFCNGTTWLTLGESEPPSGTICGYTTNALPFDPVSSYCKGYHVRVSCPPGYTQSHWIVPPVGNGHIWFCAKN